MVDGDAVIVFGGNILVGPNFLPLFLNVADRKQIRSHARDARRLASRTLALLVKRVYREPVSAEKEGEAADERYVGCCWWNVNPIAHASGTSSLKRIVL
jgi:hypothetical protein